MPVLRRSAPAVHHPLSAADPAQRPRTAPAPSEGGFITASPSRLPAAPRVGYREVLHVPCARRLLAGTLIGRMPTAMAPLALLLVTADAQGYGTASAEAAVYLLASAVGGPLSGRLADRYGQVKAFTAGSALSNTALIGVVTGPRQTAWAVGCVLIAGTVRPALESGLRALWGPAENSAMPTRAHQQTALALETAVQELIYIVGPLAVMAIAVLLCAQGALLATAALGMAGTAVVVSTPVSRAWRAAPGPADWLGPIRSAPLRTLYLAMVGVGIPIGAITPLAVAAAARFHTPSLAGVLPAALSAGAVLGGLLYGARTRPGTPNLTVLSGVFAAGWLPLTAAGHPATAAVAAAVAGLSMAALLGSAFVVAGSLAPSRSVTEAYALLVAALDIGCALGTAAAGLLPTAAILPAGAAAGAAVLAAAGPPAVTGHRPVSCSTPEGA
ncbi:MFS transporter [Streptomyces sp. NPDC127038]|uniref:MFS transporter n=1 Tax=Streptomyces sp. NPDC127038 TaxID=3347114 RepID=UPI00364C3CF5